jgi:hypothetical protein
MGSSHVLPLLCHLHLKSCAVPDLPTFSAAPAVEWLSLDNCDVSMYPQDIVLLWPRLSWLEVTYTHQVGRGFAESFCLWFSVLLPSGQCLAAFDLLLASYFFHAYII